MPLASAVPSQPRSSVRSLVEVSGLLGRYWGNSFFGRSIGGCPQYSYPLAPTVPPTNTELDPNVDYGSALSFNWHPFSYGSFSVNWTGELTVPANGTYDFELASDDGSWLYVDSRLVVDRGGTNSPGDTTGSVVLIAGVHSVVVDFYEACGGSSGVDWLWAPPGSGSYALVPTASLRVPENASLLVRAVDSGGNPLAGATVSTFGVSNLTNRTGVAGFALPPGQYTVDASLSGYTTAQQTADVRGNVSIQLTLPQPYVFLGPIPSSNLNVTPSPSGYTIQLLSLFPSSTANVFFDWAAVGNLSLGAGWHNFSAAAPPSYIVMAAAPGSADYPDAYFANLSPPVLPPGDLGCGAFQDVPLNPWNPSITVNPDPPVVGSPTVISVALHNSCSYAVNLSELDFQISGLNIGGTAWTTVGVVSNISLAAGANRTVSVIWDTTLDPTLVGLHHCVRIYSTYYTAVPQCPGRYCPIQHNFDLESDLLNGETGVASFTLGSVFPTAETATISVTANLPAGWTTNVTLNGQHYGSASSITLQLEPGQDVQGTLQVIPAPGSSGQGTVRIGETVGGQLYGGLEKQVSVLPPGVYPVSFQENGLSPGTNWSVTVDGTAYNNTSSVILVPETDGSHSYSVGPIAGFVARPSSGTVTVAGASKAVGINFQLAGLGPQYCVAISPGAIGVSAGLSAELKGKSKSGDLTGSATLDFEGGLTLTPTLNVCLGTTPGFLGLPSPSWLNVTEDLVESADASFTATGSIAYDNSEDPTVLGGPYYLGVFCLAIVCFDVQAEIDLEVQASLTASVSLGVTQAIDVQASQNYSFAEGAWTQVPTHETCVDPSASLATGCTTFSASASIQGSLTARLGPKVSLDAYGLAGVYLYPYAELAVEAGASTGGTTTTSDACGSASLGWAQAAPWVVGCAAFGVEVGGNVLGDDFATTDWTIFGVPVAASVTVCDVSQASDCASSYDLAAGGTNEFVATAAVSGVTFGWTSSCFSGTQTGPSLAFSVPASGTSACTVTADSGLPLAIPPIDLSAETIVVHVAPAYPVQFSSATVPLRKSWSVSVDGIRAAGTGPGPISVPVPNGTYEYLVEGPKGYLVTGLAPVGNLTVNGTNVTVGGGPLPTIGFARGTTHTLSFARHGLPRGTPWCVVVGVAECTTAGSMRITGLSPGVYPYSVLPLAGQTIDAVSHRLPVALSGWANLRSGSEHIQLHYAHPYAVTFTVQGLPLGTNWSVRFHGVTYFSEGSSLVVEMTNGSHGYRILPLPGYKVSGHPRPVRVNGGPASVTLVFRLKSVA